MSEPLPPGFYSRARGVGSSGGESRAWEEVGRSDGGSDVPENSGNLS